MAWGLMRPMSPTSPARSVPPRLGWVACVGAPAAEPAWVGFGVGAAPLAGVELAGVVVPLAAGVAARPAGPEAGLVGATVGAPAGACGPHAASSARDAPPKSARNAERRDMV